MGKAVVSAVTLALAILVAGCATLPMESNLEKPVSMTRVTDEQGEEFAEDMKALWLFWGAMPLVLPTVDEVAGPQVADHTGVQNLKVTTFSGPLDVIVTLLTDGILTMRTVTIEGEVYDELKQVTHSTD